MKVGRGIEDQVVHFRGGILAILGEPAERDALAQVGGVLYGDLLAEVVADLVQLDEEVLEHERRVLRTDQPGRLVALIVGLEVLAQIGLGVAAADLFEFRAEVAEEVSLNRFSQVPGRMLRNPFAGFGNRDQLRLAGRVLLLGRHLPGQLGIAMRQADDGPHDDEAGFIEVELAGVGQAHVEGRLTLLDLLDHGGQAMVVDPGVVQVAAATRPVEEADDEAGVVAGFRIEPVLLLEDLQRAGLQRPLFPVVERPLVHPLVLRVLALLDGVVVLHPIDVPFRIRVDAVDGAGHAAHEEVVVDVELLPLQQGGHELGATHDVLVALSGRVDLLHDPDPLEIDLSGRAPELFLQPVDPCGIGLHAAGGALLRVLCRRSHCLSP